jgi:hypothetical protein
VVTQRVEPLIIVRNCRNSTNASRRSKLMFFPPELYEDIEARSEGPLNQVIVELVELGWSALQRRSKPLVR